MVMMLPDKYRTHLRISNMIERVNEEVWRWERVVRSVLITKFAPPLIGCTGLNS